MANQYPNQRVMIIREEGEIETEKEFDNDSMPPLEAILERCPRRIVGYKESVEYVS